MSGKRFFVVALAIVFAVLFGLLALTAVGCDSESKEPAITPTTSPTATSVVSVTPIPTAEPPADVGKIAFTSRGDSLTRETDLWIINPDGSGKTLLAKDLILLGLPSWSPSGNWLAISAFQSTEGDKKYYGIVYDLVGNRLAMIELASEISWSPDGNAIIYDEVGGVFEFNLNTKETRQILDTTLESCNSSPVWSPDGKKLAYAHIIFCGWQFRARVVSINETKLPYKGATPHGEELDPDLTLVASGYIYHYTRFQWTPDSEKFIFSAGGETLEGDSVMTIYVADVATDSLLKIQPEDLWWPNIPTDVDLSNDGKQVVFVRRVDDLYIIDIDGTNMRKILSDESLGEISRINYPRWSPDDNQIAFVSHKSSGGSSVQVMNADGTGLQEIPGTEGAQAIAWTRAPQ